jgi:hypothetical protein
MFIAAVIVSICCRQQDTVSIVVDGFNDYFRQDKKLLFVTKCYVYLTRFSSTNLNPTAPVSLLSLSESNKLYHLH